MRELEFIPDWYRTLHRRRRLVMLQVWLTVAAVAVLGLHIALANRNVRDDVESLNTLHVQLDQTNAQLQKLHEWQKLKQELSQQADIVARLGLHVPTARILNALDDAMPQQMGLLDFSMDTQLAKQTRPALVAAGGTVAAQDHCLSMRLHGVAPTDVELGNFLARLASVPYFGDIAMSYSKDRVEGGHLMRQFEVTFTIDLSDSH